jgi:hypothetical protein
MRDPKFCQNFFDANTFDRKGSSDDWKVDRLLELSAERKISLIMPHSVRMEIEDAGTPHNVRRDALSQIFTLPTEKTAHETEQSQRILAVIRGNAMSPGKHVADAAHVADLDKYGGGYFITNDQRLLKKQREISLVAPGVLIVTLDRFLEIYGAHFKE